ncbi:MAG: cell division protein FtsQ [Frankiaceae bacterium]|nr:cell division protein FtsQ [Frankiaceae bacterium]
MSVITDARPRLAQRSAHRRHRLLRRLLPIVAGVAAVAGSVWLVLFSSVLGVHGVAVVGAQRVAVADVLRVAAVPAGQPLARLDTAAIAARVRTLAPVDRVVVQRQWPRGVRLVITERVPFAVVTIAGQSWFVDRSGVPFDRGGAARSSLPHMSTPHPGVGDAATTAGLDVLAALPSAVLAEVQSIDVPGPEQVTLRLAGGKSVVWGSADQTPEKAAVLPSLLKQPGTTYDVSTPSVVSVR